MCVGTCSAFSKLWWIFIIVEISLPRVIWSYGTCKNQFRIRLKFTKGFNESKDICKCIRLIGTAGYDLIMIIKQPYAINIEICF